MTEPAGDIEMKVEPTIEAKPSDDVPMTDSEAKNDDKPEEGNNQHDDKERGDRDDASTKDGNNGQNDNDNNDDDDEDDEDDEDDDDDDDDDDEDQVEAPEPLATTRSRRANAGNRMSNLIQEEEDEFYTNIYGGFNEEDDDGDFDDEQDVDDEEVEDDYSVDSDFSIDETDEIAPEHQAVDEEPKRKRGVYRDPKPRVPGGSSHLGPSSSTPVQSKPKPSSSMTPQSPSKHRAERSFRDSTKKKTAETIKNIETGSRKKKKLRRMEAPKKLTQEEMLEEAKITEEENLKSLEIYQRLESEKLKKMKLMKKTLPVPYVTYYSSIFTNPETKEKYTRNFCTYVGCEPQVKNSKTAIQSKK